MLNEEKFISLNKSLKPQDMTEKDNQKKSQLDAMNMDARKLDRRCALQ